MLKCMIIMQYKIMLFSSKCYCCFTNHSYEIIDCLFFIGYVATDLVMLATVFGDHRLKK